MRATSRTPSLDAHRLAQGGEILIANLKTQECQFHRFGDLGFQISDISLSSAGVAIWQKGGEDRGTRAVTGFSLTELSLGDQAQAPFRIPRSSSLAPFSYLQSQI